MKRMRREQLAKIEFRPSFDLAQAFAVVDGKVFRKLGRSKKLKPLDKLLNGKYFCIYKRFILYADQVIWALHYGNWPMFHLHHVDGTTNYDIDNLLPVRGIIKRKYESLAALAAHYEKDYAECLKIEADRRESNPALEYQKPKAKRVKKAKKPPKVFGGALGEALRLADFKYTVRHVTYPNPYDPVIEKDPQPTQILDVKPKSVHKTMRLHKYKGRWYVIPAPRSVADDYILRIKTIINQHQTAAAATIAA